MRHFRQSTAPWPRRTVRERVDGTLGADAVEDDVRAALG
jgi:hypothetical protein